MLALIIFIGIKSSQLQVSHADVGIGAGTRSGELSRIILTDPWNHKDFSTLDHGRRGTVVDSDVIVLRKV